jgi:hypothetical protein
MSLYLFDTDHVSLYQMGHPRILQQINARDFSRVAGLVHEDWSS